MRYIRLTYLLTCSASDILNQDADQQIILDHLNNPLGSMWAHNWNRGQCDLTRLDPTVDLTSR